MQETKKFITLLTPSGLSAFLGIAGGILLVAVVIVLSHYSGSDLQQQIFSVQSNEASSSVVAQNVTEKLEENKFFSSAPLLLAWAAVGVAVYYLSITIAKGFSRVADMRDEINYVHTTKQQIVRDALKEFGLRLAALIGWFVWLQLSLKVLVPYVMAAAYAGSQELTVESALFVVLALVVFFAMVHGHAILLRLIALKPRALTDAEV